MPPRGFSGRFSSRLRRKNPLEEVPTPLRPGEGPNLARAQQPPAGSRPRSEPTLEELAWVSCTATRPADCAGCCEPIGRGEKAYRIWPRKGAPRQFRERLLCRWCGAKIAEKREATAEGGEGARG